MTYSSMQAAAADIESVRNDVARMVHADPRQKALVLTKLDEARMWAQEAQ